MMTFHCRRLKSDKTDRCDTWGMPSDPITVRFLSFDPFPIYIVSMSFLGSYIFSAAFVDRPTLPKQSFAHCQTTEQLVCLILCDCSVWWVEIRHATATRGDGADKMTRLIIDTQHPMTRSKRTYRLVKTRPWNRPLASNHPSTTCQ